MKNTAAARWRALIEAQEQSGQGVREFAAARGVNATTLYWWRSRLRQRGAALVPVTVLERAEASDSACSAFELEMGEITLRIPRGFAESDLRRLLQALRC
jgi:transposase-like protein